MTIFDNPWIVGIGGGILSSLVVAFITRFIFSRRDYKEYAQKVLLANTEVLYAIRPGISENVIPTNEVVEKLISATARKYGVGELSMYDLDKVSSELIKEVMDSSFISASAKQDFCEKLTSIREVEIVEEKEILETKYETYSRRHRRQSVVIIAVMTGLMTTIIALRLTEPTDTLDDPKKLALLVVPAFVAIFASILVVLVRGLAKFKIRRMDVRPGGIQAELKRKDERDSSDT